jgi:hypothetical protein
VLLGMGGQDRAVDGFVARAPAQVPGERFAHALERGLARGLDQAARGEDHTRCADAALRTHLAHHRALERVIAREPLDRGHVAAFRLRARHQAGDHRLAIHEHGARAALALAAAFLRAGEPQSSRSTSSRRFNGCASTSRACRST